MKKMIHSPYGNSRSFLSFLSTNIFLMMLLAFLVFVVAQSFDFNF